MNKEAGDSLDYAKIEKFKQMPPNLKTLQKQHIILDALGGEYSGKMNEYPSGVVSYDIVNTFGKIKATLGMIPTRGMEYYTFNTGENTEFITPLENGLEMAVDKNPVLRKIGETLKILPGHDLILRAKLESVLYLCTYNNFPSGHKFSEA